MAAVRSGRNLNVTLETLWRQQPQLSAQQRGAITDLCYGTLRFGGQLEAVLAQLLDKPLQGEPLHCLLLVALYQLNYTRAAAYAIVDHAVRCSHRLREPRAAGLVNAVLRNFLRRREALLAAAGDEETGRYSYPQWWIDKLRRQFPQRYAAILDAGNRHPPLTLRVNSRTTSCEAYLRGWPGLTSRQRWLVRTQ